MSFLSSVWPWVALAAGATISVFNAKTGRWQDAYGWRAVLLFVADVLAVVGSKNSPTKAKLPGTVSK